MFPGSTSRSEFEPEILVYPNLLKITDHSVMPLGAYVAEFYQYTLYQIQFDAHLGSVIRWS